MYLVGIDTVPAGTPSLFNAMIAASVVPPGSISSWYGIPFSRATSSSFPLTMGCASSPEPPLPSMTFIAGPPPSFVIMDSSGTPGTSAAIVTSNASATSGEIL
ncbi:hypothetical protein D1872_295950 [compost metagenome]